MTIRSPVSVQRPIWNDAMQVDNTDLSTEQTANESIEAAIINNHVGSGILPQNLVQNILFDSNLATGLLDGLPIQTQNQPSDQNYGNQLSISLTNSKVSGTRQIKICVIGLDFNDNLQYETFYFNINETQTGYKHFTKVLLLLFNDFIGASNLSFNLGGRIVISEASPMTLSRDTIMVEQDQQPNLFFRDFFLDNSLSNLSLATFLQNSLPLYNTANLNIYTVPFNTLVLLNGDVTTQIGQKFQATTNNIQKVTLLLSVRNTNLGQQTNLVWNGDIIISIYPLQATIDCPTDLVPNLAIQYDPSNIPIAQISYNYNSLQSAGIVLNSVPQPVDFIFSNSPIAGGNIMTTGQYYAVTIKRSGAANQCDILIATGQDLLSNSNATTFAGQLWVDITDQDLWFKVYTDAAKVSDGQAYDQGNGIIIPKTTIDPITQDTIDFSMGDLPFVGNQIYGAILAAITQDSAPAPDQRTGNDVNTRQQYVPQVDLMTTVSIANLETSSEPLILGSIADNNIKTFITGQNPTTAHLYSATLIDNEILVRIVDDPTDTVRFDLSVNGLATLLLNGGMIGSIITPDNSSPSISYRVASATLSSMIVGDVDGNGIVDENDLNLLNSYIGYNLNNGLPLNTNITTDRYTTTFTNGYTALTQPFANLFNINFQLVRTVDGYVAADGYDGVLVANPNNERLAQFTSATVNFNNFVGLSAYQLVILSNGSNQANYGGWNIIGLDTTMDVLTIQKIVLSGEVIAQMFRADINEDFYVGISDGYLLNSYINRYSNPIIPNSEYPGPTTNPYNKIGTRFNVIKMKLEELVDRNDDYTSNPTNRATTTHILPDIFEGDGYYASHDFYHSPITMSFVSQLFWNSSLVVASSYSKLVPAVYTSESGFTVNSCFIEGIQSSTYPVTTPFDPGRVDFFVPNNVIIGNGGELQRPDGYFYKVDFEIANIILEIPDALYGTEQTIDIMTDFVVDYTGNGATRLGFPSMKFADCSYVSSSALADDQVRFSVAVQSFSPNINGLSSDGYYGAIVDGKMGVSMNFDTGLLTINFTNLYQDPTLLTLSTKIQVSVYLKKGGFNNDTLFVDSSKVENMLGLMSIFSGANDGSSDSSLVSLNAGVEGVLPVINGGTGLNTVGASGTVLTSTGSSVSYQFVMASNVEYTPTVLADWVSPAPTTVQNALDRIAAILNTHFGAIP